jgi:large subunit ribosomal protein L30
MDNRIMGEISITQIKSVIGSNKRQKATMRALGLKKIGQTVVHADVPAIKGMAKKVEHLITIEKA